MQANGRFFFFSFCLSYIYARARIAFFLLVDDQRIKDIVFQAYSRCPRRFTSIYYSFTNEKEEKERERKKKKERECQASYRASVRVRIWITTPFLSFFFSYLCVHYTTKYYREKKKRATEKKYKHLKYINHDEKLY